MEHQTFKMTSVYEEFGMLQGLHTALNNADIQIRFQRFATS